jgi:hypothetical protein
MTTEITFGAEDIAPGDTLTLRAEGLEPGEQAHIEVAYPNGYDAFKAAVDGDGNLRKSFRVYQPDPMEDCTVEVKAYIHPHNPELIASGQFDLKVGAAPQALIERSITDGAKVKSKVKSEK